MKTQLPLLVILLLISSLLGCQPKEGPVKATDPDAPQLNSAAKHKVRIFGTVARLLNTHQILRALHRDTKAGSATRYRLELQGALVGFTQLFCNIQT